MSTRLEDRLRAAGDWLGAALIVRWHDQGFLFAGKVISDCLQLSGLGGKVESGESFEQAVHREVFEETGSSIRRLLNVGTCRPLGEATSIEPRPRRAAALSCTRPPAHPTGGKLWIAIFVGELVDYPRPVEKVTSFVLLPSASLARDRIDLDALFLLDGGRPIPARSGLPNGIQRVDQVDTAKSVLEQPGLLERWWSIITTDRRPDSAPFGDQG